MCTCTHLDKLALAGELECRVVVDILLHRNLAIKAETRIYIPGVIIKHR